MTPPEPTIDGYRAMLSQGRAAVQGQLRQWPNDPELISGLREYRRTWGILDSMTVEEQTSPFELIDAARLRRIARGAGTTDQEVIQLLFSYRDYCEQMLRLNWEQRRRPE